MQPPSTLVGERPASRETEERLTAAEVLALESSALTLLADSLDLAFDRAIDLIAAARGKVVVTGVGKSGHVGHKIAATLASTGTPAFFVHPTEASHGDLGMIGDDDVVIALSNSGETSELADILLYARRCSIPLIGITGSRQSSLARKADVALVLPKAKEACPLGLAPTTSTTMMMALGDALAVAMLTRRGFTAIDFHRFHPGGKLASRLLTVADVMHRDDAMPLVSADSAMAEAVLVMTRCRLGCVGIIERAGGLVGIITDGDLRRQMAPDLLTRAVTAVMTKNPKWISAHSLASEALATMKHAAITTLFVLAEGVPVGVVHIHDCLRAGVG
jgi:arabinose-5-phosphate isomerase